MSGHLSPNGAKKAKSPGEETEARVSTANSLGTSGYVDWDYSIVRTVNPKKLLKKAPTAYGEEIIVAEPVEYAKNDAGPDVPVLHSGDVHDSSIGE